jgi:hypothetical protein
VVASLSQRTVSAQVYLIVPFMALCCALVPGAARGDILFTASGNSADGPISATANFHLTAGTLTLTLTNTETLMSSPGQALSQITFQVSPPMTATPTLGSTVLGQLIDINPDGSITPVQTNPSTTTWQLTSTLNPTTLNMFSGMQPDDMIAGSPPYAPNGGIKNFQPYFEGSATFTIMDPALGPNTTINGVVFSFGTSPNEHHLNGRQGPSTVPEPSSIALGLAGLLGLSLTQIRRFVRRNALALA